MPTKTCLRCRQEYRPVPKSKLFPPVGRGTEFYGLCQDCRLEVIDQQQRDQESQDLYDYFTTRCIGLRLSRGFWLLKQLEDDDS